MFARPGPKICGAYPASASIVPSRFTNSPQVLAIPVSAGIATVLPHDQRVFPVVRVVPAADAARLEAELLVESDRRVVGDAYLECETAPLVVAGQLEQA